MGMGRPFLLERMDWRVLAAGPTANLLLAAVALAFGLVYLAQLNVILAVFNMLPIRPLDGWGIYRELRS